MSTSIKPNQIKTCDFMGSPFQNSQCETVLRNLILMQKSEDDTEWWSFTWEDYKAFCTHQATSSENRILDTFVNGGKPHVTSSAYISSGWLNYDKNTEIYNFSNQMIEMLLDKYPANPL